MQKAEAAGEWVVGIVLRLVEAEEGIEAETDGEPLAIDRVDRDEGTIRAVVRETGDESGASEARVSVTAGGMSGGDEVIPDLVEGIGFLGDGFIQGGGVRVRGVPTAGGVGPLLPEAGENGGRELDGGESGGEGLAALEGQVGLLDLGQDGLGLVHDGGFGGRERTAGECGRV